MSNLQDKHDVLLADDDVEDVDIFKWALEQAGIPYTLRHAEDGDVLFVLLKERMPHILFLDIKMPCKDGIACILEIRKNPEYNHLPVIMYTSLLYATYIDEAYRCGANYFMSKPATMQQIVDNLKRIFAINWTNYLHFPSRDQFVIN